MIVLTGATGTIGATLVEQLSQQGAKFRVIARNPDKAKATPNVEVVKGSYDDRAALERAFAGATAVFALTNSVPESVQWHRNIIDAARDSGVKHLVRLSAQGAAKQSPVKIGQWHFESNEYLKASSLQWTILEPTFFMQNFLGSVDSIKNDGAFYGCSQGGAIAAVDARDIGGVAAKVLTSDGHQGKTYVLTGNQPASQAEIAEKISAVRGKPVKYVDLTPEQLKAGLVSAGLADWYAQDLVTMHRFAAQGAMAVVDPVVARLLGRHRSWDDFFATFGGAFR